MSYTSPPRPGEPPVPAYVFVPGTPDRNGSGSGCNGCDFRRRLDIRCSRIPCQRYPGMVARLTPQGE